MYCAFVFSLYDLTFVQSWLVDEILLSVHQRALKTCHDFFQCPLVCVINLSLHNMSCFEVDLCGLYTWTVMSCFEGGREGVRE